MQSPAQGSSAYTTPAAAENTGEPALLQLKEILRDELISVLDTVRGAKSLVLDKDLAGALSIIVDFAVLKDHGVEKVFLLEAGPLTADPSALPTGVIYFTLPHVRKMKIVAEQVRQLSISQGTGVQREFSLQLVPRRTLLCERVLEEEGVLGDITVSEYRMDFIPLENDLLSLELPSTFKELYLDGDFSSIQCVARAIMRLQGIYGFFPRIVGKGDYAGILADSLARMRAEMLSSTSTVKGAIGSGSRGIAQGGVLAMSSVFDSVVIIDRAVDLVTPLLTQLTYEGLISEVFGIANGYVTLSSGVPATGPADGAPSSSSSAAAAAATAGTSAQAGKRKRVALNSQDDSIFKEIRGMNFTAVGALLSKMSRQLQDTYESRHKAKTVQEIRSFVGKLSNLQAEHQSLKTHVMLAETIVKRTQSDDFDSLLDIEQTLVSGSDLNKDQLAYVEKIMALADPLVVGPGIVDVANAHAAVDSNQVSQAQNSIYKVLRILCLYSLCRGSANFKQKQYDAWYEEILAAFGHHQTITMDNLAKVGLFVPPSSAHTGVSGSANAGNGNIGGGSSSSSNNNNKNSNSKLAPGSVSDLGDGVDNSGLLNRLVPSTKPRNPAHTNSLGFLRKSLNLVVSDVRESDPDDISYVYSGYAPLSIRLLQCLVRDSAVYSTPTASRYASLLLRPLNMTLQAGRLSAQAAQTEDSSSSSVHQNVGGVKSGWGGWEDVLNELPGENVDMLQSPSDSDSDAVTADAMVRRLGEKAPATLVVFLGGCTHTEIAALRLLSQQHNHRYVAATTQVINGNSFLDPLIQHQV